MLDVHDRWPALAISTKATRLQNDVRIAAGPLADTIASQTPRVARALDQLLKRDASLWSADDRVAHSISNRLGWLSSPALMADAVPRLQYLASSIKREGFTDIVLLGMGGSSLAPEVMRAVLG